MHAVLAEEDILGKAGKDEARGWPFIASVKQKRAMAVLPHIKNMCIFMGPALRGASPSDSY